MKNSYLSLNLAIFNKAGLNIAYVLNESTA
jgi:hypothetical protein